MKLTIALQNEMKAEIDRNGNVVKNLNIGIAITTKQAALLPEEIVKRRFVWLDGDRKGEELTIHEIESIGMFLKYGAFYGQYVTEDI